MVMPTHRIFEEYARRIESEMSPAALKAERPIEKLCPICEAKCSISASECGECGYEFTARKEQFFTCHECDQLNPIEVLAASLVG